MNTLTHTSFITQVTDMKDRGQLLFNLLKEEESALIARDSSKISTINNKKKECLENFIALQNHFIANFPESHRKTLAASVDEYINKAPCAEQEQLQSTWQEWLQQQRECAKQNHLNGKVVLSNLQNITRKLSMVTQGCKNDHNYHAQV